MRHHDPRVVEYEVQFASWRLAGMRRLRTDVGAQQSGAGEKGVQLGFTEERIEITRNDDGMVSFLDQELQIVELALPVAVTKRQVNEEYGKILELQLDYQAFHPARKEMKAFTMYGAAGDERIALLVEHRYEAMQRVMVVLAFVHMRVVTQRLGDGKCLVLTYPGAKRTEVNLYEAKNVGVKYLEEPDQAIEIPVCLPQVTGPGNRQVKMTARACGIANVVKDETHSVFPVHLGMFVCRWAGGESHATSSGFLYCWRSVADGKSIMSVQ